MDAERRHVQQQLYRMERRIQDAAQAPPPSGRWSELRGYVDGLAETVQGLIRREEDSSTLVQGSNNDLRSMQAHLDTVSRVVALLGTPAQSRAEEGRTSPSGGELRALRSKVEGMAVQVESLDEQIAGVGNRFASIDEDLQDMREGVRAAQRQGGAAATRLAALEHRLDSEFAGLLTDLSTQQDVAAVQSRVEQLEAAARRAAKVPDFGPELRRLSDELGGFGSQLRDVRAKVAGLEAARTASPPSAGLVALPLPPFEDRRVPRLCAGCEDLQAELAQLREGFVENTAQTISLQHALAGIQGSVSMQDQVASLAQEWASLQGAITSRSTEEADYAAREPKLRLDGRLGNVELQLNELAARLEAAENRLGARGAYHSLSDRLDHLAARQVDFHRELAEAAVLRPRLDEMAERMDALRRRLDVQLVSGAASVEDATASPSSFTTVGAEQDRLSRVEPRLDADAEVGQFAMLQEQLDLLKSEVFPRLQRVEDHMPLVADLAAVKDELIALCEGEPGAEVAAMRAELEQMGNELHIRLQNIEGHLEPIVEIEEDVAALCRSKVLEQLDAVQDAVRVVRDQTAGLQAELHEVAAEVRTRLQMAEQRWAPRAAPGQPLAAAAVAAEDQRLVAMDADVGGQVVRLQHQFEELTTDMHSRLLVIGDQLEQLREGADAPLAGVSPSSEGSAATAAGPAEAEAGQHILMEELSRHREELVRLCKEGAQEPVLAMQAQVAALASRVEAVAQDVGGRLSRVEARVGPLGELEEEAVAIQRQVEHLTEELRLRLQRAEASLDPGGFDGDALVADVQRQVDDATQDLRMRLLRAEERLDPLLQWSEELRSRPRGPDLEEEVASISREVDVLQQKMEHLTRGLPERMREVEMYLKEQVVSASAKDGQLVVLQDQLEHLSSELGTRLQAAEHRLEALIELGGLTEHMLRQRAVGDRPRALVAAAGAGGPARAEALEAAEEPVSFIQQQQQTSEMASWLHTAERNVDIHRLFEQQGHLEVRLRLAERAQGQIGALEGVVAGLNARMLSLSQPLGIEEQSDLGAAHLEARVAGLEEAVSQSVADALRLDALDAQVACLCEHGILREVFAHWRELLAPNRPSQEEAIARMQEQVISLHRLLQDGIAQFQGAASAEVPAQGSLVEPPSGGGEGGPELQAADLRERLAGVEDRLERMCGELERLSTQPAGLELAAQIAGLSAGVDQLRQQWEQLKEVGDGPTPAMELTLAGVDERIAASVQPRLDDLAAQVAFLLTQDTLRKVFQRWRDVADPPDAQPPKEDRVTAMQEQVQSLQQLLQDAMAELTTAPPAPEEHLRVLPDQAWRDIVDAQDGQPPHEDRVSAMQEQVQSLQHLLQDAMAELTTPPPALQEPLQALPDQVAALQSQVAALAAEVQVLTRSAEDRSAPRGLSHLAADAEGGAVVDPALQQQVEDLTAGLRVQLLRAEERLDSLMLLSEQAQGAGLRAVEEAEHQLFKAQVEQLMASSRDAQSALERKAGALDERLGALEAASAAGAAIGGREAEEWAVRDRTPEQAASLAGSEATVGGPDLDIVALRRELRGLSAQVGDLCELSELRKVFNLWASGVNTQERQVEAAQQHITALDDALAALSARLAAVFAKAEAQEQSSRVAALQLAAQQRHLDDITAQVQALRDLAIIGDAFRLWRETVSEASAAIVPATVVEERVRTMEGEIAELATQVATVLRPVMAEEQSPSSRAAALHLSSQGRRLDELKAEVEGLRDYAFVGDIFRQWRGTVATMPAPTGATAAALAPQVEMVQERMGALEGMVAELGEQLATVLRSVQAEEQSPSSRAAALQLSSLSHRVEDLAAQVEGLHAVAVMGDAFRQWREMVADKPAEVGVPASGPLAPQVEAVEERVGVLEGTVAQLGEQLAALPRLQLAEERSSASQATAMQLNSQSRRLEELAAQVERLYDVAFLGEFFRRWRETVTERSATLIVPTTAVLAPKVEAVEERIGALEIALAELGAHLAALPRPGLAEEQSSASRAAALQLSSQGRHLADLAAQVRDLQDSAFLADAFRRWHVLVAELSAADRLCVAHAFHQWRAAARAAVPAALARQAASEAEATHRRLGALESSVAELCMRLSAAPSQEQAEELSSMRTLALETSSQRRRLEGITAQVQDLCDNALLAGVFCRWSALVGPFASSSAGALGAARRAEEYAAPPAPGAVDAELPEWRAQVDQMATELRAQLQGAEERLIAMIRLGEQSTLAQLGDQQGVKEQLSAVSEELLGLRQQIGPLVAQSPPWSTEMQQLLDRQGSLEARSLTSEAAQQERVEALAGVVSELGDKVAGIPAAPALEEMLARIQDELPLQIAQILPRVKELQELSVQVASLSTEQAQRKVFYGWRETALPAEQHARPAREVDHMATELRTQLQSAEERLTAMIRLGEQSTLAQLGDQQDVKEQLLAMSEDILGLQQQIGPLVAQSPPWSAEIQQLLDKQGGLEARSLTSEAAQQERVEALAGVVSELGDKVAGIPPAPALEEILARLQDELPSQMVAMWPQLEQLNDLSVQVASLSTEQAQRKVFHGWREAAEPAERRARPAHEEQFQSLQLSFQEHLQAHVGPLRECLDECLVRVGSLPSERQVADDIAALRADLSTQERGIMELRGNVEVLGVLQEELRHAPKTITDLDTRVAEDLHALRASLSTQEQGMNELRGALETLEGFRQAFSGAPETIADVDRRVTALEHAGAAARDAAQLAISEAAEFAAAPASPSSLQELRDDVAQLQQRVTTSAQRGMAALQAVFTGLSSRIEAASRRADAAAGLREELDRAAARSAEADTRLSSMESAIAELQQSTRTDVADRQAAVVDGLRDDLERAASASAEMEGRLARVESALAEWQHSTLSARVDFMQVQMDDVAARVRNMPDLAELRSAAVSVLEHPIPAPAQDAGQLAALLGQMSDVQEHLHRLDAMVKALADFAHAPAVTWEEQAVTARASVPPAYERTTSQLELTQRIVDMQVLQADVDARMAVLEGNVNALGRFHKSMQDSVSHLGRRQDEADRKLALLDALVAAVDRPPASRTVVAELPPVAGGFQVGSSSASSSGPLQRRPQAGQDQLAIEQGAAVATERSLAATPRGVATPDRGALAVLSPPAQSLWSVQEVGSRLVHLEKAVAVAERRLRLDVHRAEALAAVESRVGAVAERLDDVCERLQELAGNMDAAGRGGVSMRLRVEQLQNVTDARDAALAADIADVAARQAMIERRLANWNPLGSRRWLSVQMRGPQPELTPDG